MAAPDAPSAVQIIFKLTPHCNIACGYCYQSAFDHQDWFRQPKRIAPERYETSVEAICTHAAAMGRESLNLVLQGGEPLLVPRAQFAEYLDIAGRVSDRHGLALSVTVQTNGLLLDRAWCGLLRARGCGLAISVDGPAAIHDSRRVRRNGRGTFGDVRSAFELARAERLSPRALTVLHPDLDGGELIALYEELGVESAGLILPAHNHAHPDPDYDPAGAPYGRTMVAAFDAWLDSDSGLRVHNFDAAVQAVLGRRSSLDGIGETASDIISVSSDGQFEDGDAYGVCSYRRVGGDDPLAALADLARRNADLARRWAGTLPRSGGCRSCDVSAACRGGMLEHRYARANEFDNASYYCADLQLFYRHVRARLQQTGLLARRAEPIHAGG